MVAAEAPAGGRCPGAEMGLLIRKTLRGPGRSRVHLSTRGVSVSKRIGPLTINSRGHVTLRILPGVSWRIF